MTTPPLPPAPNATAKLRPSGAWYALGILLMLAGLGALIGMIATGVVKTSKAVDNFARFVVTKEGTEATIEVKQAGVYTFYYESQSTVDKKRFLSAAAAPPDLEISAKAQGGADLVVTSATSSISFSTSGTVGTSEFTTRVPAPGKYVVRVTGGSAVAPYVVSMGKGQIGRFTQYVLGGIGLGGLLGLGGLVTLILTATKRKRQRRAQLAMGASLPHGASSWSTPASSGWGSAGTGAAMPGGQPVGVPPPPGGAFGGSYPSVPPVPPSVPTASYPPSAGYPPTAGYPPSAYPSSSYPPAPPAGKATTSWPPTPAPPPLPPAPAAEPTPEPPRGPWAPPPPPG